MSLKTIEPVLQNFGVYRIENLLNGKIYIGSTISGFSEEASVSELL